MKATRKCSFCGKSFVTRSGMQRYCSEACQAEAKRARVMQPMTDRINAIMSINANVPPF